MNELHPEREYLQFLAEGRFMIQRCRTSGKHIFYALADEHISCAHLDVKVDTTEFHPGGSVAVTVACTVDLKDVTGLRIPSNKTLTARAVAPLDRYRGLGQ